MSIIVPTCRRPETLRRTLQSLTALEYPRASYEIVVVDDGASDATRRVVDEFAHGEHEVTYVSQERRGAGAARNMGAALSEGTLLLFCDDDILVESDHLSRQLAAREAYGDPLVNGVRWYAPDTLAALQATPFGRYRIELERRFDAARDGATLGETAVECKALYSCNLAVRRELFHELGGFDERFPFAGSEDQDFELRARHAGCLLVRDHGIRLQHIDPAVTLRQFCTREETGCQGVVMLARKYPEVERSAMIRENGRISRDDCAAVVARKLAKSVMSSGPMLWSLHRLVRLLERFSADDSALVRAYRLLIGLHIFRGIRAAA